jgi:hypothetical protein
VENILHPRVKSNPMLKYPRVAMHQPIGTVDKYPYVLMTSTVAEHWCGGSTTRNIPWLNELVPDPVLEMPIALLGLGGSTHLSNTYAWGLWIVFDLVWIAVAAGAFATAGIIYVNQRKDLYSMGRSAVLMGLLSYSFVTVTLIADLGLPWHFYQLGLQSPELSAMFEVSWCVGLM